MISAQTQGTSLKQLLYWKIATGSESTTWSWSGGGQGVGGISAYANAHPASPIDFSSNNAGIGTTGVATGGLSSYPNAMIAAFYTQERNATLTPTSGQGMTAAYTAVTSLGSPPNRITALASYGDQAAAGSIPNKTASMGGYNWATHLVSIRPSPPDGIGTITTGTTSVVESSTGNTIVFTYTAGTHGVSNGAVSVDVPQGWSPPSTTGTSRGYTTATTGLVSVSGQRLMVSNLSLAAAATLTISYGSLAAAGEGATASSMTGPMTWQAQQRGTAAGTLTNLQTSPSITQYVNPTLSIQIEEQVSDAFVTGTTLYYNPARAGRLKIKATASSVLGIDRVIFPGLADGFSPGSSFEDGAAPYEFDYTWDASATAQGVFGVAAVDAVGNTTTKYFTLYPDSSIPVLANRWRPALLFDDQDPWRPVEVSSLLGEDYNPGRNRECYAESIIDYCSDLYSPFSLTYDRSSGNPYWIDFAASATPNGSCRVDNGFGVTLSDCNGTSASAIYYHVGADGSGYRYFDYWFPYRYNDYHTGSLYDHEGDWEGVLMVLDTVGYVEPVLTHAFYSAHNGGNWYLADALSYRSVIGGANHPMVYVANGTHASYNYLCTSDCDHPDVWEPIHEGDHGGEASWGWNDTASCEGECLLRFPHDEPTQRSWTWYPGKWGEDDSSPTSPGNKYRFQCTEKGYPASECSDRPDGMRPFVASSQRETATASTLAYKRRVFPGETVDLSPTAGCNGWFSASVAAVACDAKLLRQSIKKHQLGRRGAVTLKSVDQMRSAASTSGLAQVAGPALSPGERLAIKGRPTRTTALIVNARVGETWVTARFTRLNLGAQGSGVIHVEERNGKPVLFLQVGNHRYRPRLVVERKL